MKEYKMEIRREATYACDFETCYTNLEKNERKVYSAAAYNLENNEFIWANTIDDFLDKLCENIDKKGLKKNINLYFHNLKYDSSYIIAYLDKEEYEYRFGSIRKNKKKFSRNSFKTIEVGTKIYKLSFYHYWKGRYYSFNCFDSYKILPVNLNNLGKMVQIPKTKLKYDKFKWNFIKKWEDFNSKEQIYIKHDVLILQKSLILFFDFLEKHEIDLRLTISGIAFNQFMKMERVSHDDYFLKNNEIYFEYYNEIKQFLKGGLTIFNPLYKNKKIEQTIYTSDANSLYPSIILHNYLPYGLPEEHGEYTISTIFFESIEPKSGIYTLFHNVSMFQNESLHANHIVSKIKNVILFLTNEEFEIQKNFYRFKGAKILKSYSYKTKKIGEFFINYFKNLKIKYEKEKNNVFRFICKLIMNGFYGKHTQNPEMEAVFYGPKDLKKGDKFQNIEITGVPLDKNYQNFSQYYYVPTFDETYDLITGIAITSKARIELMKSILDITNNLKNPENWIYSDTDSNKSLVKQKYCFDSENSGELGLWKNEGNKQGIYVFGPKFYSVWKNEKEWKTWAGIANAMSRKESILDLKPGYVLKNAKKQVKYIKGGIDLLDSEVLLNDRNN